MENEEQPKQPGEPEQSHQEPVKEDKKKIRVCPYCKQEYKTKVGFDNWKNLFRKPTMEDWITLIILALLVLASYAYTQETAQSKYMLSHLDETCTQYNSWKLNVSQNLNNILVLPNMSVDTSYNINEARNDTTQEPVINDSNSSGNVIGGEKDEHGCIIPAGYSWCEALQECIRPWEKNCTGAVASSKVAVNVTTMSNSTNASTTNP